MLLLTEVLHILLSWPIIINNITFLFFLPKHTNTHRPTVLPCQHLCFHTQNMVAFIISTKIENRNAMCYFDSSISLYNCMFRASKKNQVYHEHVNLLVCINKGSDYFDHFYFICQNFVFLRTCRSTPIQQMAPLATTFVAYVTTCGKHTQTQAEDGKKYSTVLYFFLQYFCSTLLSSAVDKYFKFSLISPEHQP